MFKHHELLRSFVMGALFMAAISMGIIMAWNAYEEAIQEWTFVERCQTTWQAHEEPCREMYRRYMQ